MLSEKTTWLAPASGVVAVEATRNRLKITRWRVIGRSSLRKGDYLIRLAAPRSSGGPRPRDVPGAHFRSRAAPANSEKRKAPHVERRRMMTRAIMAIPRSVSDPGSGAEKDDSGVPSGTKNGRGSTQRWSG